MAEMVERQKVGIDEFYADGEVFDRGLVERRLSGAIRAGENVKGRTVQNSVFQSIASERVNDFATVVSSSLSSSAFTLRSSFLAD